MNLDKFYSMMRTGAPGQLAIEWQLFLEFCETYFKNRDIKNPIVVELGVRTNTQKVFYEQILGAKHIGIDGSTEFSIPDIVGNTHDSATKDKLKVLLGGKDINLLFIDAGHSYEEVKQDYEMYSPLTKNIIAFHDIMTPFVGVRHFWRELMDDKEYMKLFFYKWCNRKLKDGTQILYGIGVLIKE